MERKIPLEGCFNFRDLGGYPNRDGARVRWRRMFRADGLQALTHGDVEHLRDELRLAAVIDLRSTHELTNDGRGLLAETEIGFHHVPFFDGNTRREAPPVDMTLADMYVGMIERASEPIAQAIRVLADTEDEASAVYHCAAGKDRTGVLSAILLSLLGVEDELIVVDYALSQDNMDKVIERLDSLRGYDQVWQELPPETLHARPETMRGLLDTMNERFGGMEGYARQIGIRDDEIERLRDRSLE
jgi:protein tyrosine/serine phosphatase